MDTHAALESWRQEIRDIDAALLEMVARRMQLAQNIGSYKSKHQLPVKDFRVEKQIIEKARSAALQLGLYPELAEDLMSTLIHYSVLRQDQLKREEGRRTQIQQRKALIVGGAGHMGQWFASFYESLGYEIVIFDRSSTAPSTVYPRIDKLEEGLHACELIVLSTPMPETNQLLISLSELKPSACIIEICSLKSPIRSGLQQCIDAGLSVASLHPMFGPDTDVLAGKNIIFCSGSGLRSEEIMQLHFQQTSAQLHVLPLDQHDRVMSYILGASHLLNLVYAQILEQSGEDLQDLRRVAGTTFLKQLDVTSRVVAENQDLYFDIQRLNDASPQLIMAFSETLQEFARIIDEHDKAGFIQLMGRAQQYFQGQDY